MDIEMRRDAWVLWRIRLTAQERAALARGTCVVKRRVPWHLPPGKMSAGLVANGYRVADKDANASTREASFIVKNARRTPLALAQNREYHGRPAFFLNGKPFSWNGYSSYDYQPGAVAEFGTHATGFDIPTSAGRHVHNVAASANWIAPNEWDFGELEERVAFSLAANPDAILMPRVSLALPEFWTQQHPQELTQIRTESGDLIWEEGAEYPAPSLASEVWRRDQERALRELIRYCKNAPWANRIAGFTLTGGVTEEWFSWASNDGQYADYSEPSKKAYANWRRENGFSGGAAGEIPLPSMRQKPEFDVFPDDEVGRRAAAYQYFASDKTAETIEHFARIVKDETGGRSLVGTFHGYVIQLAGDRRQASGGHFALRRILDNSDIDFIGGIPLLNYRTLSEGYNPTPTAMESLRASGKIFCSDNDLLSWLHPVFWNTEYDANNPRGGAISMHRRECANDAVHGSMPQKFSLMASWHHDAALHREFAFENEVLKRALNLDKTPTEEIAFVVDDTTFAWTPPETRLLYATNAELLRVLGRTGAPVGVWLLSDLHRLPTRIKFVVVASATAAKAKDIAALKNMIERGGRTILVVGAAGLINFETQKWDSENPSRVLGLPLEIVNQSQRADMLPLPNVGQIPTPVGFIRPRATTSAPAFAHYADGPAAGAERALPNGGKLIWMGAAPLSTPLLRSWIEAAGVHCYAPSESFVHAARGLVSITNSASGMVPLRFPRGVAVTDLFDGWKARGAAFSCPFEAGQTRLFAVTPL